MGKCKNQAVQVDLGTFTHIPAHSGIVRHIQGSGILRILCNTGIFRILVYSEHWYTQNQRHIQNPDILKTLSNIYDEAL